jgi:hypothetical protein
VHIANSVVRIENKKTIDGSKTTDLYTIPKDVGVAINGAVNRTRANSLHPKSPDINGNYHEEGFSKDPRGIHVAPPGPAWRYGDSEAALEMVISSDAEFTAHSHPAGNTDPNKPGRTFEQEPSAYLDLPFAARLPGATHILIGVGDFTVKIFDSGGVIASVPLDAFPNK